MSNTNGPLDEFSTEQIEAVLDERKESSRDGSRARNTLIGVAAVVSALGGSKVITDCQGIYIGPPPMAEVAPPPELVAEAAALEADEVWLEEPEPVELPPMDALGPEPTPVHVWHYDGDGHDKSHPAHKRKARAAAQSVDDLISGSHDLDHGDDDSTIGDDDSAQ